MSSCILTLSLKKNLVLKALASRKFVDASYFLLGAVLLVLVAACGDGHAPAASATNISGEIIPISVNRGHASVKVFINNQAFTFLLDSGADQNVINARAATQLGLPLSAQTVPGNGAAGSYGQVHWIDIAEIQIGRARLPRQAAFVVPLPEEATFDGVLGAPFFQAFVVQMDFQQKQLQLHSHTSFVAPVNATPVPIKFQNNKLLVNASAAGVSGWYVIDTGDASALTMFTPTVEKYALRQAFSQRVRMVTGIGAGGAFTENDVVRVPDLQIGPFRMTQVITGLSLATEGAFGHPMADTIGNLGSGIWRRFNVTFDTANEVMYLQANEAFAQPFDGPRSGLTAALDHTRLKVIQVIPSSPAAQAGVQLGDIIASIEIGGSTYHDNAMISETLHGAAGALIVLHLIGADGLERQAPLILRDLL